MGWRQVAAVLWVAGCGGTQHELAKAAPARHDEAFQWLVVADVPRWAEPRRLLVDVHGQRATVVTSAPPGLRVLEGSFSGGKIDVAEHTSRANALSITGTRDGDRIAGEWREGSGHFAFTTRKPPPFAARGEGHAWSGFIGAQGRVRVRLRVEQDEASGTVLHLEGGESALSGSVDAFGQIHLEESRGDRAIAVWQGAFLDPNVLAGWRTSDGEPARLFTLQFASTYPEKIALWDGLALAPEVYHAESSRECWADTTLFRVTGLTDRGKAESLDLEIARWIGIRRLDVEGCFGGGERFATVTWKKPPYAQLEIAPSGVEAWYSRCALVDTERGHLVKLFDLVKDKSALDRFVTVASKPVRCHCEGDPGTCGCGDVHVSAASTMCMEGDHVTVEDTGLPQTTIPKSELARIFDVRQGPFS